MIQKSTSLKHEPSLELLLNTAEQLFLNRDCGTRTGDGPESERKHGFSAEPLPVSASVGSSKNLKDLPGVD